MIEQFSYLTKGEIKQVMNAPALITLLIACSDKGIDRKEVVRAHHLMKWKKYHARPDLTNYYKEVSTGFSDGLDQLLKELPSNDQERKKEIEERLKKLNDILPKFDREFAEQLYHSYLELAKGVAEASGGVLGYLSINIKESKLINLPMIDDPRTYNI